VPAQKGQEKQRPQPSRDHARSGLPAARSGCARRPPGRRVLSFGAANRPKPGGFSCENAVYLAAIRCCDQDQLTLSGTDLCRTVAYGRGADRRQSVCKVRKPFAANGASPVGSCHARRFMSPGRPEIRGVLMKRGDLMTVTDLPP
jgi:hypothetical protein